MQAAIAYTATLALLLLLIIGAQHLEGRLWRSAASPALRTALDITSAAGAIGILIIGTLLILEATR